MFRTFPRQAAASELADFADTQVLEGEFDLDDHGFAPTQILAMAHDPIGEPAPVERRAAATTFVPRSADVDWRPSSWATLRWVEEQEAKAEQTAQRLRAAQAAQMARGALAAATASRAARRAPRRSWLQRFEDTLDRVLPGNLSSLLQLFICVSLSMALISAFLPLVDKI